MTNGKEHSIDAARRSFNEELLTVDYPRTHDDDDQVSRLVAFLAPKPDGTYLDLATGNGAVAFAVAGQQAAARVIGIDIADKAIARNKAAAIKEASGNVEFHQTNGRDIDFPSSVFDGIACRYAFHHFPDVDFILADARRVLKSTGTFVLADAVKHPNDNQDFINRFQALKPDGHVRIYTADDLIRLFCERGFEMVEQFGSAITFTRDLSTEYHCLIKQTAPKILNFYDTKVDGDIATLTFEVENFKFITSPA